MRLGVTEYIDCAHHLPGHPKCGQLHGHTYQVDVSIEGDHAGGMLLDFADLKKAVRDALAEYDHKDWNTFLKYPTVENICELILQPAMDQLSQVPDRREHLRADPWPAEGEDGVPVPRPSVGRPREVGGDLTLSRCRLPLR